MLTPSSHPSYFWESSGEHGCSGRDLWDTALLSPQVQEPLVALPSYCLEKGTHLGSRPTLPEPPTQSQAGEPGLEPLQVPSSPGLGGSQRPTNSPNCFSHSIRPPDQSKERGRGSGEQRRPSYPRAETLHPLATHRKPVVSTCRCWDHKPGTPRNGLKSSYPRKRIQPHG